MFANPLPIPESLGRILGVAAALGLLLAIAPAVIAIIGMVRRYRAAEAVARLQMRWFAWAAAVTLVTALGYLVFGVLLSGTSATIREGSFGIFVVGASSLPIAVLVAISRYHLYDIDTIIGRTLAYGALTAILAGLYAASLRLFNALFVAVVGHADEAALVLTTLVLATTFTPIKSRLERLAAARFKTTIGEEVDNAMPGPTGDDELDARIEKIARRVALEVLDASTGSGRQEARSRR